MSAIVCGKRSIFEDLHTPPPVSKRLRCAAGGGTSPIRFSPTRAVLISPPHHPLEDTNTTNYSPAFSHLKALFPDMDDQILERALQDCGNDLDSAIKSLNELCLGSAEESIGSLSSISHANMGPNVQVSPEGMVNNGGNIPAGNNLLPVDGSEWVELFVKEMMNASDIDDARGRAAKVLEVLEKSIMSRAGAGAVAADNFHKENLMLKEQMEVLMRDNSILKRAITIQHERQKEHDERTQEVQQLKQLVTQYQEQLRTLEVTNYALTMHLQQAQQSNSIPGRFHPDVF